MVERLRALGAEPIEFPVIEIRPPDSWNELDSAIARLKEYDWIVFASANAVKFFAQRVQQEKPFTGKPHIAVIGASTERAAQEHGMNTDYKPDQFVAESFIQEFPGYPNLSGLKVLWPRTNIGRNYIKEHFVKAGAHVDVVAAYQTCLPTQIVTHSQNLHKLLAGGKIDVITLASAQTAANLASIIAHKWKQADDPGGQEETSEPFRERISALLKNVTVLSIGPETSSAARNHLGKLDLEANPHTAEGLVNALINQFAKEKAQK
jgi:uroporphyrinogen III methyltransferase/synthase